MSTQLRPIILILVAAVASMALSITLWFSGQRDEGVFVGLWVPSILALGAFVLMALRWTRDGR